MKITINDTKIVIFLNKMYINIKYFKENIELELKKIWLIINKKVATKLTGFYEVKVYIDNAYGLVLKIEKQEDSFFMFNETLDMHVEFIPTKFLFLLNNLELLSEEFLEKGSLKIQNNQYYFMPEKINNIEMGQLIEHSQLIYER